MVCAVCPFSFARPKENGPKEKGAEIETHVQIIQRACRNFGASGIVGSSPLVHLHRN